jgi:hypothetical protein
MEASGQEMPAKDKENSELNDNVLMEAPSSLPTKAHYDNVKMKYFNSLGMSKPPSGPLPNRERGSTVPTKYHELTKDLSTADREYIRKPISPARKRSISTPLNTTKGIPIPGVKVSEPIQSGVFQFDSDEELSGDEYRDFEEEPQSYIPGSQFIPPHEMLAKGDGFEVGTARSLAVWESQRRKKLNDVSE